MSSFQEGVDAYKRGDYDTALKEFRPLAEQGHADAQYNLGVMYEKGLGVPQDDQEAVRWFRLAAEQGIVRAQVNLGFMYVNGQGVQKDYVKAYLWYAIAAAKGDRNSARNRDDVAKQLTPAQITETLRLIPEWKPKK